MLEQPAFLFAPHLDECTFCPCAVLGQSSCRPLAGHGRDPRSCERVADLLHEVRGRAAPQHVTIHSTSESNMMIRRSSGRRYRRNTAPTPPVNFWVYFDTALALMNSPRHSLIYFTAGCNATTTPTIRIADPNSAPAAPPTRLAHDPRRRRHGGVDAIRARVPPLRLQAGEARRRYHSGSLLS